MKHIVRIFFFASLFFSGILYGQKPENLKFEGYLKNQPKYYLPDQAYTVKYAVSDWFKEHMANNSLKLELKGFNEGDGLKVIFISDDPVLYEEVVEKMNLTSNKMDYKAVVETQSNAKVIIVTNQNELIYEISIKPHLFSARSEGLGVKSSKKEAEAQNEEIVKKRGEIMRKAFVKEIIKEYQDTLDALFGKFNKTETFHASTIKAKNFNYDDYNSAAEKFKTACSTPEIDKDEIKTAIDLWEKCKIEYQPGKKTRICDVNIDDLYLNLMQAYLVVEDYENTKINWEKCLEIKGNRTAEGYIKQFYDKQLEHIAYYPVSKKNYSPKSLTSNTVRRNNSLFFNLILSHLFTQMHGNRSRILEYFPSNLPFIQKMEAAYNTDKYITENLTVTYSLNGSPISAKYHVYEEGEKDIRFNFQFNYEGNKIISANENGTLRYLIKYDGDNISEIHYGPGDERGMIYLMDYSNPEKIEIKIRTIKNGKSRDSSYDYYAKFNDNGILIAYYIDIYSMQEIVYDTKGNWTGIKATNESSGRDFVINFKIETDDHGISNKLFFDEEKTFQRKFTYLE